MLVVVVHVNNYDARTQFWSRSQSVRRRCGSDLHDDNLLVLLLFVVLAVAAVSSCKQEEDGRIHTSERRCFINTTIAILVESSSSVSPS